MAHRLVILTGASRGLGAALAEQLLTRDTQLLCMARGRHPDLAQRAAAAGTALEEWPRDLADSVSVAQDVERWLYGLDPRLFDRAVLINNAGVIPAVGPTQGCDAAELSAALRVGLEAAILLSAAFLRATLDWPADRRILHVSSGLGRRAMAGSAVYCAVKAGMDHHARCVALDEAHAAAAQGRRAARIVSLAPGVIDTDMQVQLRSADAVGFPDQHRFAQLHASGELTSAAAAARRVLAYLGSPEFGSVPVADVRDA